MKLDVKLNKFFESMNYYLQEETFDGSVEIQSNGRLKVTEIAFEGKGTVSDITVENVDFYDCAFTNVLFSKCSFKNCNFYDCYFCTTNFVECEMEEVNFDKGVFDCVGGDLHIKFYNQMLLKSSKFNETEFIASMLTFNCTDTTFKSCDFRLVEMFLSMDKGTSLDKSKINRSEVDIVGVKSSYVSINESSFHNSLVNLRAGNFDGIDNIVKMDCKNSDVSFFKEPF